MPLNSDNDRYAFEDDNDPMEDLDHDGKINYENDLLPIVPTPSTKPNILYVLDISDNLKVYKTKKAMIHQRQFCHKEVDHGRRTGFRVVSRACYHLPSD